MPHNAPTEMLWKNWWVLSKNIDYLKILVIQNSQRRIINQTLKPWRDSTFSAIFVYKAYYHNYIDI